MTFKEYFSLDKIGKRLKDIKTAIDLGKSTTVFYAVENARYHIASNFDRFFLYVVADRLAARRAQNIISAYIGEPVPIIFERDDVLINNQTVSSYSLGQRLKALADITQKKVRGAIISAEGIMQFYPQKELFENAIKTYKVDDVLVLDEFFEYLVTIGYKRVERPEDRGCFSARGDVINIYSYNEEMPYRIELFDNQIEKIKYYDPENLKAIGDLKEITIFPASDILVDQKSASGILKSIENARKNAKLKLGELLFEMKARFSSFPSNPSLYWLLPFFKEQMSSIFDYLDKDSLIVFDDLRTIDDKLKLSYNSHLTRVKSFIEGGQAVRQHQNALLKPQEIYDLLREYVKLGFSLVTSSNPVFEPQEVFNIKSQSLPKYYNNFAQLCEDIKNYASNGAKVFIHCKAYNIENFIKNLKDNFIGAKKYRYGDPPADVNVIEKEIPTGFVYNADKLVVIGTDDIERKRQTSLKTRKRSDFVLPEKGDYVVHEKHGIGISEGMQRVKTSRGEKDFYVVLYKDGDRLYLPAGQLDSLEKYSGADKPTLHKLGGAEFEKVKKRARASIKKMTIDLMELYERRLRLKGHKYQPDTPWQKEMEDNFEFEETVDQITATNEIKSDMEQGKIMDRLLCGDVGYGKTEVAIRAIFKTVIEGKQAAVLAPTTILAQQHYNTIVARLNPYKIKIALLNRFVSSSKIKQNLEKIKNGEINIIVGTHRLLSKDVVFHDLGLLVLDEEQRFGVEHKEKIKTLRSNVNVLSLTATPIPRTLHMSLSGIRDISILETPPVNRIPIETYVTEYSDSLIMDAVMREVARDGQVFILYNKVATIEAFYKKIAALLGDKVTVIYAHGQMPANQLEKKIKSFYNREVSVLISTTIIENGIDLPYANTLIVIDADTLGLSQLYQLRGRVGRSSTQAYAYFTVREGKVLTENAVKRLEALMEYTDLSSGLKIALRDLDIRGAGNVLGREQSGQMEKIGYDMYCRMIKESIDEARGKKIVERKEIELDVEGDSVLSEDYISANKERIKFYKRVSSLSGPAEAKEFIDELTKLYSKPPKSVMNIIILGVMKNLGQNLNIRKITIGEKGAGIYFYDDSCLGNARIIDAISRMKDYAVLFPTSPPCVMFKKEGVSLSARIKLVMEFLTLANKQS